jgi:hypothetical protein
MSYPAAQIGVTGGKISKAATQRLEHGNQPLLRLQDDLLDNFREIGLSISSVCAGQSG